MDIQEFFKLLMKRKQTVTSVVIVCLAIAMLLVVVQPLKYGSSSRLLVSQEFTPGADAYTISQSNNYLSKLLSQVVGSGSFYNDVMDSGYNIDSDYFTHKNDKEEEMEEWNQTVQASSPNTGSGLVNIEVFHPDRGQAEQIAQAVNYILRTKNQEYHSLGNNIFLKVIDRPIVSERPVKPDIFLIFPATILLAIFLAGTYIYFFPEDKYDIKIISNGRHRATPEDHTKDKKRGMIKELGGKIRKERSSTEQAKSSSLPAGTNFSFREKVESGRVEGGQQQEKAKERIPFAPEPEQQGEEEEREEPAKSMEKPAPEENKRDIEKRGDMSNIFG